MESQDYWQEILPPGATVGEGFPARFDDGRALMLPVRRLPDQTRGLASLIINQASFDVVDAIAADLASKLASFDVDVIVGLPTLGLTLASATARLMGHTRYVPLGTSLKFWYDATLAVPLSSVTTPNQTKQLYIDPRLLGLLRQRRVALLDDVISSGTSILAGLQLLRRCDVTPVVVGAAMLQSDRWQAALADLAVVSVLRTPMLDLAATSHGN